MADPLRSARIKLDRANLHSSTAKREARRFFKKHPAPTIRIDLKSDLRGEIRETADLDIVIDRGLPDLPESFPARFGDAIHNYRCALDHVAWQLVKHGRDPNPAEPHRVQFPIYAKRTRFFNELAARLPGVDTRQGGPCEFIERRHRYKGGKARNDILIRLARLSNDDKHRSLHAVISALAHAEHNVTFTHCRPTAFRNPPAPPKLKADAVVAHLTVVVTGPNPKVEVVPHLHGYIALEGWSDVYDVLAEIRAEVTEIINAPQILRAL